VIVSTTLAGPGAEASIGAALLSCANLVDEHLILVARAQLDSMAAAVKAAGIPVNRLRWRIYEWPGSYGEARTASLRFAEEEGASWALTVDSDELVDVPRLDLADADPDVHVLCVPDSVLAYQKPRLIRCGARARWIGPCSERLDVSGRRAIIPGQFHEAPKTPEQEAQELTRKTRAAVQRVLELVHNLEGLTEKRVARVEAALDSLLRDLDTIDPPERKAKREAEAEAVG